MLPQVHLQRHPLAACLRDSALQLSVRGWQHAGELPLPAQRASSSVVGTLGAGAAAQQHVRVCALEGKRADASQR